MLNSQAFLEYYDSRALVAAVEEMDGKKLFGGSLQVKYAWDQPLQAREQIPRKRESRDERSAAPPSKSSSQRDGRDHRDGRDGRDSRDNRDNRPPPMPTPAPPAPQSLVRLFIIASFVLIIN